MTDHKVKARDFHQNPRSFGKSPECEGTPGRRKTVFLTSPPSITPLLGRDKPQLGIWRQDRASGPGGICPGRRWKSFQKLDSLQQQSLSNRFLQFREPSLFYCSRQPDRPPCSPGSGQWGGKEAPWSLASRRLPAAALITQHQGSDSV